MQLYKSKFHFVGIGGIGMCGLAELLHNMGARVSGSDLAENANTEYLQKVGIEVFRGHRAENVGNADVVVYSSAVHDTNPEIQAARALKIPLIARAEALAEIMHLKRGVAVAGTHGKTTTTSMAASIFIAAQSKPTIVVGGRLNLIQSTALLGDGEWIVAEADESDGSFAKLSPEIAIITNIDSDHLDHYKTFENLQKAFVSFAQKVPFYGACIACGDDPQLKKIFQNFPKRIIFYGFDESNDWFIKGSKGKYEVFQNTLTARKKIGDFDVNVPGRHNALNALAAIVCGMQVGFSFEDCRKGMALFEGVDRRFQFKGEKAGVLVYDDYGHHPTEVAATLQAFREKFPEKRIVVYFQPHRYSRTQSCWHEFTTCFSQCDQLLLADIYPAGEVAIEGITSAQLIQEIKVEHKKYVPKSNELSKSIAADLKKGDVFVTLGAGDAWKLGLEVLENIV